MNELEQFRKFRDGIRPPDEVRIEAVRRSGAARRGRGLVIGVGLAAAAVLLFTTTALAWPAIADTWLKHSTPREVAKLPTLAPNKVTYAPTPSTPRRESLAKATSKAGFMPLVPGYLPPGCMETERFAEPDPIGAIYLNYSCGISITEQRVRDEKPFIGQGSSERTLVNGKPAIYIKGAWVQYSGEQAPVWDPAFGQGLIFEEDGLLIHMEAGPEKTKKIHQGGYDIILGAGITMPKDELIRVAESLQRARSSSSSGSQSPTRVAATPRVEASPTVEAAGFTPLVPTYLPSGCVMQESLPPSDIPGLVVINYSCPWTISITEQLTQGEQPYIGPNSSERITIDGRPAIHVQGAWVREKGKLVWEKGFTQELILERGDVVIHISAAGPPGEHVVHDRQGNPIHLTGGISKAELVRMAGSLRPQEQLRARPSQ